MTEALKKYYNLLEPFDKQLWVIEKTGTISGSSNEIKDKILSLVSIYETYHNKKVVHGCGKCLGRALRILAKDYHRLKAEAMEIDMTDKDIVSDNRLEPIEEPTKNDRLKEYYLTLKYQELRNLCKERNIPLDKKDKKQDLIDKLNDNS